MRTGLPLSAATRQMVANHVSRIDAVLVERARAIRELREQEVAVVVEVADQRRCDTGVEHALLDGRHGRRGLRQVHCNTHQLGTRLRQLDALRRRAADVRRVGVRHRLDGDRRPPADLNRPNPDADCLMKPDWQHLRFL
jgi:hypothetical protein